MAARKKTLNIGMVGYGFMARAHSHAWSEVSHFFDTGYQPVCLGPAFIPPHSPHSA